MRQISFQKIECFMPYCPHCKSEYLPQIIFCSDCGKKLVAALPVEEEIEEVTWQPLRGLPGYLYAEMVKEVLDKKGIPCVIKSDDLSSSLGAKSVSAPGSSAQIFVPEHYHKKCQQIILEMMDHI